MRGAVGTEQGYARLSSKARALLCGLERLLGWELNLGPASSLGLANYDLFPVTGLLASYSCHLCQTGAVSLGVLSNPEK